VAPQIVERRPLAARRLPAALPRAAVRLHAVASRPSGASDWAANV